MTPESPAQGSSGFGPPPGMVLARAVLSATLRLPSGVISFNTCHCPGMRFCFNSRKTRQSILKSSKLLAPFDSRFGHFLRFAGHHSSDLGVSFIPLTVYASWTQAAAQGSLVSLGSVTGPKRSRQQVQGTFALAAVEFCVVAVAVTVVVVWPLSTRPTARHRRFLH